VLQGSSHQAGEGRFFCYGDNGGLFEAGGDCRLVQGEVAGRAQPLRARPGMPPGPGDLVLVLSLTVEMVFTPHASTAPQLAIHTTCICGQSYVVRIQLVPVVSFGISDGPPKIIS